jgi:putative transposase
MEEGRFHVLCGAGEAMKKSRYTEEQVTDALRLAESGTPVADVCRQMGIAEATFYLWKKKHGGLGVSEVHELRQMREENARLKRLVPGPNSARLAAHRRTQSCSGRHFPDGRYVSNRPQDRQRLPSLRHRLRWRPSRGRAQTGQRDHTVDNWHA